MASSLEKLEQTHNVQVMWRAYELRPAGAPPMPPEHRSRIEAGRPRMVAMAKNQYGLDIDSGPFGINSRKALIGTKFAEHAGKGKVFHDRVFRAYWQEARDISDEKVLAQLAVEIGLDAAAFVTALHDPQLDAEVQEEINQAYAYGLEGVPALVFNEKYLVSGAQPLHVLQQVSERVSAE